MDGEKIMQKRKADCKRVRFVSESIVLAAMVVGAFASYVNHNAAAVIIMLGALLGYCLIWYKSKNLFDFLGLMYLGFVFPLGMANLRWAKYQNDWEIETWICFILAVLCYMVGYSLKDTVMGWFSKNRYVKRLAREKTSYNGMFVFGIIVFICLLSGFFVKWWVAGSLPMLNWQGAHTYIEYLTGEGYLDVLKRNMANMPLLFTLIKAYHRFSTIFLFQGWLASCAVYGYCVTCRPKIWKKAVSWVIIIVSTIIPCLIVVREIFMMQTVAFAVFAFMIHDKPGKKYWMVVVMVFVTIIGFVGMSKVRGYTKNEIAQVFEMNEETYAADASQNGETGGTAVASQNGGIGGTADVPKMEASAETRYPAMVTWVYTYFTCGYDNFNFLTKKLDYHTYGLMELRPIFSALQIDGLMDIDMKLQDDKYRVSPNVTVYTFLCDAYVDFGILGVAVSMVLWGLVFGLISETCIRSKGSVSTILYSGIGHHIIFMAFVSWMGHFSYLCSFGLLFIYFVVCLVKGRRRAE